MYQRIGKQAPTDHDAADSARQCEDTTDSIVQIKDVLASLDVDSADRSADGHVVAMRQRLRALMAMDHCISRAIALLEPQPSNGAASQDTELQGGIDMDRLYLATAGLNLKTKVHNGKRLARMSRMVKIPRSEDSCLRVTITGSVAVQAGADPLDNYQTVSSRRTFGADPNGWVYQHEMRIMSSSQMTLQVEVIKKIGQKIQGNQMRLMNWTVAALPTGLRAQ